MYANMQWQVTPRGLETLERAECDYWITAAQLVETRLEADGPIYEFFVDLGLKTWLVPEFLEEAYDKALAVHAERLPNPVDVETWERSKKAFRANVMRRRAQKAHSE